jgi:hypothetical protein
LLGFEFQTREQAQRLAEWIKERLGFPDCRDRLQVEIIQISNRFKVQAVWIEAVNGAAAV